MKKQFVLLMSLCMAFCLAACGDPAETPADNQGDAALDFPTRNIEVLGPYSAGGGLDLITRYATEAVDFPVSVSFTEMAGGSSLVCVKECLNGDLSGHRYMALHPESMPPYELSGVYDKKYSEDFNWICSYAYDPMCIAVGKDSPINNWEELVADANARPGEQTWGGSGNLSTNTVGAVLAMWAGDFDAIYVPYKGAADARVDCMAGNLDVFIGQVSEMVAYHESGDLKIICTEGEERSEWIPDIPTLAEITGTTEKTVFGLHRGLVIPKAVPEEIRQYLEDKYREAVSTEEWKQGCADSLHYTPGFWDGEECAALYESCYAICEEAMAYVEDNM